MVAVLLVLVAALVALTFVVFRPLPVPALAAPALVAPPANRTFSVGTTAGATVTKVVVYRDREGDLTVAAAAADELITAEAASLTNVGIVLIDVRDDANVAGDVSCVLYVDGAVVDQRSGRGEVTCLWVAPRT